MVGQYLGRYAERYGVKVRTGCEVVSAERSEEGGVGKRWRIEVKVLKDSGNAAQDQESGSASTIGTQETRSTEIETHQFDHIIITCGFFGSPRIPAAFQHTDSSSIPVIHSSAFRDISTLLGSVKDPKPGKILVVGGSISGAEIAAHVANQLSSEKYSPEKSQIKGVEGYTVEHVMQKPFWTLPLFVPRDPLVDGEDGEKVYLSWCPPLSLDILPIFIHTSPSLYSFIQWLTEMQCRNPTPPQPSSPSTM
jgi:hypothetical protein